MAHTTYRNADGLNDTPVSAATPLPVTDAAGASAASPKYVTINGLSYTDVSIASLTANQANGIDPIIAASASRKAIVINPPANCGLSLSAGGLVIWPIFANVPNGPSGEDCPTNALYLTAGLSAGQALPMAVA